MSKLRIVVAAGIVLFLFGRIPFARVSSQGSEPVLRPATQAVQVPAFQQGGVQQQGFGGNFGGGAQILGGGVQGFGLGNMGMGCHGMVMFAGGFGVGGVGGGVGVGGGLGGAQAFGGNAQGFGGALGAPFVGGFGFQGVIVGIYPCGGRLTMLTNKEIQKDLKLTPAQTQKVQEIMTKQQKNQQALLRVPPQDQIKKVEEYSKANEKAIDGLLKKEQSLRLKQLALQKHGANGLLIPEVADALKITEEQKKKFQDLQQDSTKEIIGLMPKFALGDPKNPPNLQDLQKQMQEMQKKGEEVHKKTQEKLLNELTSEQRNQWQEMLGTPFQGRTGSTKGTGSNPIRKN